MSIPMIATEYENPNFVVTINKTEVIIWNIYLFSKHSIMVNCDMLNIEIFRNENVLN